MTERSFRVAGVAVALVGAAVSGYLLYVRYTDATLVCSTGGCDTVQSSRYSEVFGLPVAALGLIGFVALAIAAAARGETARIVQAVVALAAAGFSTYLLYVQVELIEAICDWCVVNDVIVSAAAGIALLRLAASPRGTPPGAPLPRGARRARRAGGAGRARA